MKRRVVAVPLIVAGALGVLPVFAGTASAGLPPIAPPGVVNPLPANPAAQNDGTYFSACYNILTKNRLANEAVPGTYPVVGTAAFETRGEFFCGL